MLLPLINNKKVRYNMLVTMMEQNLSEQSNEVIIYFDIESLTKQFYTPGLKDVFNTFQGEEKYMLSSELINIFAHYRHFFWSRFKMYTQFYGFYSTKKSDYIRTVIPSFRQKLFEKWDNPDFNSIKSYRNRNLKLSRLVSPYLSNIHIINTGFLEPKAIIPYIMSKNENDPRITNLILTNNEYNMDSIVYDNTFVLTMRGEKSQLLTKENIIEEVFLKKTKTPTTTLPYNMFPMILALGGYTKYGIEKVKGFGKVKAIKHLEKLFSEEVLVAEKIYDMTSFEEILEDICPDGEKREHFMKNYRASLSSNLLNNMSPAEEDGIYKQIDNIENNRTLLDLNRKYYSKYPLQMLELREGEN